MPLHDWIATIWQDYFTIVQRFSAPAAADDHHGCSALMSARCKRSVSSCLLDKDEARSATPEYSAQKHRRVTSTALTEM